MNIPLSSPDITEKERKSVLQTLETPNLSLGPKIPEFEHKIAIYTNVNHAVAVSSGTAVLHILVKALGITSGDYVLTTPFSFISTANCVLFEGAEPIFVDIDKDTYNITPEGVEKVFQNLPPNIRRKTKAVIYTDVFGVAADGEGFEEFGRKNNLYVIEDSAEALGSSWKGRKCGSFGVGGLFAFYPNKQITTGEGGVLVTNDKDLASMARSLRNQGRDEGSEWLLHNRLGYNYRISDIHCALGIAQLERIKEIIQKRRQVKKVYDEHLRELYLHGALFPQVIPKEAYVSPFVFVLRLSDRFDRQGRDHLIKYLKGKGIQCSNYFTPIHLQPYFHKLGWRPGDMPITESISEKTIALPFFNNITEEEIDYVVKHLQDFFSNGVI